MSKAPNGDRVGNSSRNEIRRTSDITESKTKWCSFHKTKSHDSSECRELKKGENSQKEAKDKKNNKEFSYESLF